MSDPIPPQSEMTEPPPVGTEKATSAILGLFGTRDDKFDLLKALFLGALVTALFYEVFPLPFIEQGRVLTLFNNPISEIITGMTLWSLFVLLFKYLRYRLQQKANQAFAHPDIQAILTQGVYARNVDQVLDGLQEGFRKFRIKNYESAVIFRRVFQVLRFIRSVPKRESINDLLEYQAQIDLKKLESGYSILQVFIWAIPILGFIGTVVGIGDAVREFSIFIQTAETGAQFSAQMRNALGGVTSGLAVAFNTTFLALLLVIPVMILTSFLQKNEEEILMAVEEYCLEELLPHLRVTPSNDRVTETFDDHMHRIMQLSSNWLGQLEPLVERLSRQAEMISNQIGGVQPLVKAFTDELLEKTGKAKPRAQPRTTAMGSPDEVAPDAPERRGED